MHWYLGFVCVPLLAVKLMLKPTSSQSPAGLGDTKETSFCNVTEDIAVADPRKGEWTAGSLSSGPIVSMVTVSPGRRGEWGKRSKLFIDRSLTGVAKQATVRVTHYKISL